MSQLIDRKNNSPSRYGFWLRWLAVPVIAAIGLLASVFLAVREDEAKSASSATTVPPQAPAKAPTGDFPPAFTDARPDLPQSPGYVDVCGIGRVAARSNGQPDLSGIVTDAEQLIETAAARAAASGSDYDRAIALYLARIKAADHASTEQAAARSLDDRSEQLARLAVGSRDPGAYALAFYSCGKSAAARGSAAGTCGQISATQWALIDADNAVPWLYEAGLALQRQDSRAVDAALLRASQARVLRMYEEAPLRLIDSPTLRTAAPAAAMTAAVQLIGITSAIQAPNLQLISQYCAATARNAAERSQACSDLAELLTTRSTALIGMRLGTVVGERVGWSNEKLAAVRKRTSDLQQANAARASDAKDLYSCGALERNLGYLSAFAKYGEIGALERQATASAGVSGRSPK